MSDQGILCFILFYAYQLVLVCLCVLSELLIKFVYQHIKCLTKYIPWKCWALSFFITGNFFAADAAIITEKTVSRPSCLWFSATVVLVSQTFSSLVTLNVTYFKHLQGFCSPYFTAEFRPHSDSQWKIGSFFPKIGQIIPKLIGVIVGKNLDLVTVSGNIFLYFAITYPVICALFITFFCTLSCRSFLT